MTDRALKDILVTEIGSRIGAGICGSILAQLGATVVVPEMSEPVAGGKAKYRSQLMPGKSSIAFNSSNLEDRTLLRDLVARSEIVIVSSDRDDASVRSFNSTGPDRIVCDITAFGDTGPLSGKALSDMEIQALSGIMDTTGLHDGPPTPIHLPIVEIMTGVYAAVSCLAALRTMKRGQGGQEIDMAMYDCAFAAMATFFPRLLDGGNGEVGRVGNCHAMAAPWNAYQAQDGWILVCAASNAQWRTICDVIGEPKLADDERYLKVADRVSRRTEVDALLQNWVGSNTIDHALDVFSQAGIPCGPVTKLQQYPREANLEYRQMIRSVQTKSQTELLYIPSSPFKMTQTPGLSPTTLPEINGSRALASSIIKKARTSETSKKIEASPELPLAGFRVVEIGHYTTAPLSARHLANLGADVVKIEPPDGEAVRGWPPAKKGNGYFFTYTNAGKRSLVLDLEKQADSDFLKRLLVHSDILIENLKPGALAKRGFSAKFISELNPRIIYCSVSGFGADSIYAGRPAYDSVIQAMSGFMDITRASGIPVKSGISFADILGAEMATAAILAALEARDSSGFGQYIDLSMQDVAVWSTMLFWNDGGPNDEARILTASDGFVYADSAYTRDGNYNAALDATLTKSSLSDSIRAKGFHAAPVLTTKETIAAPQTNARTLITYALDEDGDQWPLLTSPLRLKSTAPATGRPMTALGGDRKEIIREIGQLERAETA